MPGIELYFEKDVSVFKTLKELTFCGEESRSGLERRNKAKSSKRFKEAQTMGFRNSQETPVKNRRTNLPWLN